MASELCFRLAATQVTFSTSESLYVLFFYGQYGLLQLSIVVYFFLKAKKIH